MGEVDASILAGGEAPTDEVKADGPSEGPVPSTTTEGIAPSAGGPSHETRAEDTPKPVQSVATSSNGTGGKMDDDAPSRPALLDGVAPVTPQEHLLLPKKRAKAKAKAKAMASSSGENGPSPEEDKAPADESKPKRKRNNKDKEEEQEEDGLEAGAPSKKKQSGRPCWKEGGFFFFYRSSCSQAPWQKTKEG